MKYLLLNYNNFMNILNNPGNYIIRYGEELQEKNARWGSYKVSAFTSELLTELFPEMAAEIKYLKE